ncbi:MAG TPA: HSP90 family protein [Actinocrinis sp.]|jgi:molecular chaperone HtpG|uniref:HSP90 family protein n=1 Tax=Actinocrinis sp. TaxID=1920516 RepID=UPI002DDD548C|nr:HSP90 family protein [Actinocrinis sp.]HEV3171444.1 HSP90 family protein [Actinocrinis sp.]
MSDEESADDMDNGAHAFQVDLRGLVDLLSHHLYSSPRIYVRELLQNAVDAVTARHALDPAAPGRIRLRADGGSVCIEDAGIGLTEADVHRFLATIGRSSKRDDLAGARREFLGQFGIGLLACFTVADTIRVVTRSAADPDAGPVEWLAGSDGRYTIRALPASARETPGTTVELTPRPGAERWFAPDRVVQLAREFGSLLPYEVVVESDGHSVRVTDSPAVWDRPFGSPAARRLALFEYGERTLGFPALDVIELDVPVAGVRGVAYVLPSAANPTEAGRHRVHLKGMLLSDATSGLLPEWAFFVRCVIDTDTLRPTASREGLYEDETLSAVREALGRRIRDWLTTLAAEDPARLGAFLAVHTLGVKALARHDRELLRIMLPFLEFETTDGRVPLTEFARNHPTLHLARTVDEFRQVAPIAAAQGIGVVNGGYTYDAELVEQLPQVIPGTVVGELGADVVTAHLDLVDPAEELTLAGFLSAARATLDPLDCDVVLRAFAPVSVPALHLDNREARHERARAQTEAAADELWAEILGALKSSAPRAQLVLNHHSPVVRRLTGINDRALLTTAVEALYGQALLMTHRPLRPADTALLNRAFGDLLSWASMAVKSGDEV